MNERRKHLNHFVIIVKYSLCRRDRETDTEVCWSNAWKWRLPNNEPKNKKKRIQCMHKLIKMCTHTQSLNELNTCVRFVNVNVRKGNIHAFTCVETICIGFVIFLLFIWNCMHLSWFPFAGKFHSNVCSIWQRINGKVNSVTNKRKLHFKWSFYLLLFLHY